MNETAPDDLQQRLTELGTMIITADPPDDLARRVLARDPIGLHRSRTIRRRVAAAVAVALLIALAFTPPVRAAVSNLLQIGGVLIMPRQPDATPRPESRPPSPTSTTVDGARDLVDFDLVVPDALGVPDRVLVTDDRRVVSMQWGTGKDLIICDQFDGRPSPVFAKMASGEHAEVDGRDAVWVPEPHPLIYIDAEGVEHSETARLAGPALIFERGAVTVRIEGLARADAIRVAESG
jgi:hypothetical protein